MANLVLFLKINIPYLCRKYSVYFCQMVVLILFFLISLFISDYFGSSSFFFLFFFFWYLVMREIVFLDLKRKDPSSSSAFSLFSGQTNDKFDILTLASSVSGRCHKMSEANEQ